VSTASTTEPTTPQPTANAQGMPEVGLPLLYGMRLVCLASWLIEKPLDRCELLELGCGTGEFLEGAHRGLGLNLWGSDRTPPAHGRDRFIVALEARRFDVVLMSQPVLDTADAARGALTEAFARVAPGGALVFQTAPALAADALAPVADALDVARRWSQAGDPAVHAWRRAPAPETYPVTIEIPAADLSTTGLGRRDGTAITDARADGVGPMVFGPYRDLEPGRYRAEIHGRIDGRYGLKLTGERSTILFATQEIDAQRTAVEFVVRHYCTNFECVIRRGGTSRGLVLDKIVLHRLGPPA
jgi:hypothetical protein